MTRVYCVIIPNSVRKTLEALAEPLRARIVRRLDALASNPRPKGAVKLTDQRNTFRLRTATGASSTKSAMRSWSFSS